MPEPPSSAKAEKKAVATIDMIFRYWHQAEPGSTRQPAREQIVTLCDQADYLCRPLADTAHSPTQCKWRDCPKTISQRGSRTHHHECVDLPRRLHQSYRFGFVFPRLAAAIKPPGK